MSAIYPCNVMNNSLKWTLWYVSALLVSLINNRRLSCEPYKMCEYTKDTNSFLLRVTDESNRLITKRELLALEESKFMFMYSDEDGCAPTGASDL